MMTLTQRPTYHMSLNHTAQTLFKSCLKIHQNVHLNVAKCPSYLENHFFWINGSRTKPSFK